MRPGSTRSKARGTSGTRLWKLRLDLRRRRALIVGRAPYHDRALLGDLLGRHQKRQVLARLIENSRTARGGQSDQRGEPCVAGDNLQRAAGAALEILGEIASDLVRRLRHFQVDREYRRQCQRAGRSQDRRQQQQREPGRAQDALMVQQNGIAAGDHDGQTGQHQQRRHAGDFEFAGNHRKHRHRDQRHQREIIDHGARVRVDRRARDGGSLRPLGAPQVTRKHDQNAGAGMRDHHQQQQLHPGDQVAVDGLELAQLCKVRGNRRAVLSQQRDAHQQHEGRDQACGSGDCRGHAGAPALREREKHEKRGDQDQRQL